MIEFPRFDLKYIRFKPIFLSTVKSVAAKSLIYGCQQMPF